MSNLATLSSNTSTMTSREIAELTEKQHSHVCRDIRTMIDQLYGKERKYAEIDKGSPEYNRGERKQYKYLKPSTLERIIDHFSNDPDQDHQEIQGVSEERDERGYVSLYHLDRDHTYTLIAGYRADLRFKIIKRWQEIEAKIAQPQTKLTREERYRLGVYRDAVKTARMMGFNENMALLSADNYCKNTLGIGVLAHMGATHLIADQRGKVYTPTELGQLVNPPMSAVKFNLALEAAGLQCKEMGTWMPCDAAEGLFEWADTGKKHSLGTPVKQLRWFKDVLGRLPSEMVTTH